MKRAMYLTAGILALAIFLSACRTYKHEAAYKKIEQRYQELEAAQEGCITPFIKNSDTVIPEGKELMQIMIVRHGKPRINIGNLYTWQEAEAYIHAYDTVSVERFLTNPVCLSPDLEQVYCSVLPRSKSTAQYMCGDDYLIVEDLKFREFEREIPRIPFIKMPLYFWLVTARIPWYFGWGDVESYDEAVERSKEVADFLAEEADQKGKVLLVAHGFLNRFVFDDLQEMGWYQARKGGHDYLAVSVFVKLRDKGKPEAVDR